MHESIRQAMVNIANNRPAYLPSAPVCPEPDMSPQELETLLRSRGIIGQDKAVRTAAIIVYRHFVQRCASVNLFCGPTGCGKTQIWRVLAAEFPHVRIFDSSTLTNEGWRGSNKMSYHFRAMLPECREKAILVFDEFEFDWLIVLVDFNHFQHDDFTRR